MVRHNLCAFQETLLVLSWPLKILQKSHDLVRAGCYTNAIDRMAYAIDIYFPQSRGRKSKTKVPADMVPGEGSPPGLRRPPARCVFTWQRELSRLILS